MFWLVHIFICIFLIGSWNFKYIWMTHRWIVHSAHIMRNSSATLLPVHGHTFRPVRATARVVASHHLLCRPKKWVKEKYLHYFGFVYCWIFINNIFLVNSANKRNFRGYLHRANSKNIPWNARRSPKTALSSQQRHRCLPECFQNVSPVSNLINLLDKIHNPNSLEVYPNFSQALSSSHHHHGPCHRKGHRENCRRAITTTTSTDSITPTTTMAFHCERLVTFTQWFICFFRCVHCVVCVICFVRCVRYVVCVICIDENSSFNAKF